MAAAALIPRTRAGRPLAAAALALALLAGGGAAQARAEPPAGGAPKVWRALADEQRAVPAPPVAAPPAVHAAGDALAVRLLVGALLAVVAVAVASYLAGLAARRREALSRARAEAAALLEDAGRVEGLWRRHLRSRRR